MGGAELFFVEGADAFVSLAWALFLVVVVADFTIGFRIIIYQAYGDPQAVWPIHATIIRLLLLATVLAPCVAIGASIALGTSHPALAAVVVVSVWALLAVGGATSIALTPAGPQELFSRSVGDQKFSMPRRYKPPNEESSGGFGFIVCLNPFDEPDRQLWRESAYVGVRHPREGLDYFIDIKSWHANRHAMKQLEPLFDHDQFIFTWPLDYDPSRTASNFYLVRYDGDRLVRLVRCYGISPKSKCTQYVFSDKYILMIDSKMWALEHWADVERNVAALIASWRTPARH
jgi:hypothetical protein